MAGYAFTYAAGMITGGRLGDRHGYRRLFIWGVAAFTVASVLCGIALNPAQLVAARLRVFMVALPRAVAGYGLDALPLSGPARRSRA
ncbi:hypothetical protein [Nonomuraea sp. NPDC049400]|uniref:hypothetical protein n=1 Tax=Nonomuraea sp. NPDC049400 TaxID=3364352 RepID=UPI003799B754